MQEDEGNNATQVLPAGMLLMISGLGFIFVGLPVLSAVGLINYNSSYGMPVSIFPSWAPQTWATVNHKRYSLLANMRRGLIDPDTPEAVTAMTVAA